MWGNLLSRRSSFVDLEFKFGRFSKKQKEKKEFKFGFFRVSTQIDFGATMMNSEYVRGMENLRDLNPIQ